MASLTPRNLTSSQSALGWFKATTGSLRDVTQYKNPSGSASLEDAAMRCILQNLDALDYNHLTCLPWTIRRKLWAEVKRLRLNSVRTWQMFVRACSHEQEGFQDHKTICIGTLVLPSTLKYILKQSNAPRFEWLAHVALQDSRLPRGYWCTIKELSNLASLLIYNAARSEPADTTEVDDRVIKAWSIAAREEGAFSRLRVLHIHDNRLVTKDSLLFLACLPCLKICHFMDYNESLEEVSSFGDDWWDRFPVDKARAVDQEWNSVSMASRLGLQYEKWFSSKLLADSSNSDTDALPRMFLYDRGTVALKARKHLWLLRNAKQQDHKEADIASAGQPERKKRKLRVTKEKDIGDLLGQMGG
ncbi:uncharacterized protein J3D65DRAFT_164780 [Phyllosticta citribraziliensis]|uniref:Uncharacterized protein n=1 Tax=Phyllosticta citribraziliensis TaxID=989973 RepID=A0ABR1L409_9PEZI